MEPDSSHTKLWNPRYQSRLVTVTCAILDHMLSQGLITFMKS